MPERTRVAILGGGMAGVATAWELVDGPDGDRYEITIYQRDWRLGGKCASGRSIEPRLGHRIEEHGIHVLPGFYENVFHLLKRVYDDVHERSAESSKILDWKDALKPSDTVAMADRQEAGPRPWKIRFPRNRGRIGGPPRRASPSRLYRRGRARYRGFRNALLERVGSSLVPIRGRDAGSFLLELLLALLLDTILSRIGPALWLASHIVRHLERRLDLDLRRTFAIADGQRHLLDVRRLWIATWFAGTNLLGMSREGLVVPPRDFLRLDDEDYMDWLARHSVVPVPNGDPELRPPPVQALYDLAFSHEHTLAAGTTLWVILHMGLDYKGSFVYEMNGGMGDVVFAPIYLALERRPNVTFQWYHEVEKVVANECGDAVETIRIREHFRHAGSPLHEFDVGNRRLLCWPNARSMIAEPVDAVRVLRAGEDFDVAVLAISHGALSSLCPTLCSANDRFRRMAEGLSSIPTQSLQLWLNTSLEELGWRLGSTMLISLAHPFNSWTDMAHLLDRECWPPETVETIAYFSDELRIDPSDARDPDSIVGENAIRFVTGPLRRVWPDFDWKHLHDPDDAAGPARLDAQYLRANVDASDRYVLCARGTTRHRLAAGDSGFANLALAGDWIRSELNAGCVEAAAIGGREAAAAIREGRVRAVA